MAKEVLQKIKDAESESDRIIADAKQKIKDDGDKIISETNLEVESLKRQSIDVAEKRVKSLLSSEEENVNKILEIDEKKIDEVVNLLAERIVK